jgi:hypothetical protein
LLSGRIAGLEELQPVAERIVRVKAAMAGKVWIPPHLVAGAAEPLSQDVQVAGHDAGWAFRAAAKPSSTPRWISSAASLNQHPPRSANTGGFASSLIPSTPA